MTLAAADREKSALGPPETGSIRWRAKHQVISLRPLNFRFAVSAWLRDSRKWEYGHGFARNVIRHDWIIMASTLTWHQYTNVSNANTATLAGFFADLNILFTATGANASFNWQIGAYQNSNPYYLTLVQKVIFPRVAILHRS